MQAIRLHSFGEPLRYEEVPDPVADEEEVLVEIAYAGVNPIDLWLSQGAVRSGSQALPFIPGSDASGFVDGKRVVVHGRGIGVTRDGLYRDRATVPADAVVELPETVDLRSAAAIGVPGTTAWLLAHGIAALSESDRVLVLGCSGGVGHLVAQLAKNAGAAVLGQTTSVGKVPFIEGHVGCQAIVAGAEDIADKAGTFEPTVVFDPLGDGFTGAVARIVAPKGMIVVFGTSAGPTGEIDFRLLYKKGITVTAYAAALTPPEETRSALEHVVEEVAAGRLEPIIGSVVSLRDAQLAHRRLEAREVTGKILLQPGRPDLSS